MAPISVGVSASSSSAAESGETGAFSVTGGGKSNVMLWVVLGLVAIAALFFWKGGRRA
jgi:hypothetical protein